MSRPHRRPGDRPRPDGERRHDEPGNERDPHSSRALDASGIRTARDVIRNTAPYWWWHRRRTAGWPMRRNPLCRRSDRLQRLSAWLWFLVAALTIPVVTVAVAPSVVDGWQAPAMAPTTAVVEHVSDAPVVVGPSAEVNIRRMYDVRVRWVNQSGAVRRASLKVSTAPHQGAEIRIWSSASGNRIASAEPRDSRLLNLIVLNFNIALDVSVACYGLHRLLRWRLDRYRQRAWDADLTSLLSRK